MGNKRRLDNGGLDAQQGTEFKQLVDGSWKTVFLLAVAALNRV